MSVANEGASPSRNEPDCGEELSPVYLFGWGGFRPRCLQRIFNNAKAFLVLLTLANIMQGITINGLLKVSVTSIERRFNLLSSESGLIISGYDIAGCISLLPISYLGGKSHKPRWIGAGLILTSFGSLMLALPHFLTGPYIYNSGISDQLWISQPNVYQGNASDSSLCKTEMSLFISQEASSSMPHSNNTEDCSHIGKQNGPYLSSNQMKYIFLVGQFFNGIGCTPLAVLAVTFIDESVNPQVYPGYIGIYYMGALVGPAIGFILGGQLLNIFTEIGDNPTDITPESPQWVGAWWVGFLISSAIMFVLAIPILGYPKKLPSTLTRKLTMINIKGQYSSRSDELLPTISPTTASTVVKHEDDFRQLKHESSRQIMKEQTIPLQVDAIRIDEQPEISCINQSEPEQEKHSFFWPRCDLIHKFFRDLLEVTTNKAFIYLSVSAAVLGTLVSGFSTFGPKFIESQFGKSASDAANLFGYVCIPAGACGLLIGSSVMSGLKLEYKSSLRMCFCVSVLGLFAQFSLTLHCDDIPLAGINVPYNNQAEEFTANELMNTCNKHCRCSSDMFDPICGSDGITYYSMCFAGCNSLQASGSFKQTYANCSCIPLTPSHIAVDNMTTTLPDTDDIFVAVVDRGTATRGKCATWCWWQNVILVGLFLVISTTFFCAVPGVDLSLRCFPQHLRSLSVGVQWILIRTLGTIPGPIIFGAMIDSTCQIWNKRDPCAKGIGACMMYKNQELSFSLLILSVIYKGASILFFGLALLSYKPARLVATESPPRSRRQSSESPL